MIILSCFIDNISRSRTLPSRWLISLFKYSTSFKHLPRTFIAIKFKLNTQPLYQLYNRYNNISGRKLYSFHKSHHSNNLDHFQCFCHELSLLLKLKLNLLCIYITTSHKKLTKKAKNNSHKLQNMCRCFIILCIN